jgi:hypothetical protein
MKTNWQIGDLLREKNNPSSMFEVTDVRSLQRGVLLQDSTHPEEVLFKYFWELDFFYKLVGTS